MKNLIKGTLLFHLITSESEKVLAQYKDGNYGRGGLFNYDTGDFEQAYSKAASKSRSKPKLKSLVVKKIKSGTMNDKKGNSLRKAEKDDIKNPSQFIRYYGISKHKANLKHRLSDEEHARVRALKKSKKNKKDIKTKKAAKV
jgi:hypothetical protein